MRPSLSRVLAVGQQRQAVPFPSNEIINSRYTAWNFLFYTLALQFSQHMNRYFLLIGMCAVSGLNGWSLCFNARFLCLSDGRPP